MKFVRSQGYESRSVPVVLALRHCYLGAVVSSPTQLMAYKLCKEKHAIIAWQHDSLKILCKCYSVFSHVCPLIAGFWDSMPSANSMHNIWFLAIVTGNYASLDV